MLLELLLSKSMKILQILAIKLGYSDNVFKECYFAWFFV